MGHPSATSYRCALGVVFLLDRRFSLGSHEDELRIIGTHHPPAEGCRVTGVPVNPDPRVSPCTVDPCRVCDRERRGP